MMGRLKSDQGQLFHEFHLGDAVPEDHLIRKIDAALDLSWLHGGLSEVGSETIRRAYATHPISDLQIEYSLISRGIESDILKTCRELGIGIIAYGVLSRGLTLA